MKFLLLWCAYDCDNYCGHRIEQIEAPTLAEAKTRARAFLDSHWQRRNWEFRLVELGEHDSGYRLWDKRSEPNEGEVRYTIEKYWDAK